MKKNPKRLAIILSALLVLGIAAGVTIAWLSDQDRQLNEIRIARIGSTPTEPNWPGEPGTPVVVYPGVPQAKDPTVTVDANTEPAYVRVLVRLHTTLLGLMDGQDSAPFTEMDGTTPYPGASLPNSNLGWVLASTTVDPAFPAYSILEYQYASGTPAVPTMVTPGATGATLTPVFNGFLINEDTPVESFYVGGVYPGTMIDMNIEVVTQTIQAAGNETAPFLNMGPVTAPWTP